MIIPIELRFEADKDSKSAFRTEKTIKSHDINTVEFHITIEGLELTDNYTAKILSIFHSSKSQVNVDCDIADGKIIYKPDTNLISRHEHVTNYVYVYNGNQSLDVREFIYVVDLSKIDETSLEVKEVYDQAYADLLADFEQALNDYKDNLPQSDSVRADIDEILNQFSEDSQAKLNQYDTDVQQVITDNQTAFVLAESVRQAEFDTSQSERQQQFDNAQTARQESYEQTQSLINEAEESRVQAEGQRESSESGRVSTESSRVLAENERENNEEARELSEGERKANEEARELSESERENAEEQRKIDHANRSAELDGKADKVVIENLVENGDFSDGGQGWNVGSKVTNVTFGDSYVEFEGAGGANGSHRYWVSHPPSVMPNGGDVLYVYSLVTRISGEGKVYVGAGYAIGEGSIPLNDKTLVSYRGTPNQASIGNNRHVALSADAGVTARFEPVIYLNLTQTFGAGNEPTKEEMDELIEVTGYIDEITLTTTQLLNWQLNLIRQNRNAIIALGGTII